ncbi:MAG: methyltransferase domain-containing protein [Planctomycetia bacterium]
MREPIRLFVESAARQLAGPGPVVEFGAYRVAGQERLADLRPLFPGRAYTGVDLRAGPGVDRVGDLAAAPFETGSVGTLLCLETLEHVFELPRALAELERMLAPGGLLLASTPFHFHIHAHPDDYWRLTPSAWARLLAPYAAWRVGAVGVPSRPHTVLVLAVKGPAPEGSEARLDAACAATTAALQGLARAQPLGARLAWALKAPLRSRGEREDRRRAHEVAWRASGPAGARAGAQPSA